MKAGAIIPLNVENDVNGLGTSASRDHLTVLAWPGAPSTFLLHDAEGRIDLSLEEGRFSLSSAPRPVLLRMQTGAPATVADLPSIWAKVPANEGPIAVDIR